MKRAPVLRRLQPRLLASYLFVIAVGLVVVAAGVQLIGPSIFDRVLAEHMGMGRGGVQRRMNAEIHQETVDVFRTTVFQALLIAALAATIAALAASLFVSRRISTPINQIAEAARRIAGGRYDARVDVDDPAELAELGHNLNTLAAALEETESRRVALIGDVAHEIRTPLTTLNGNLEGILDGVIEPTPELLEQLLAETGRLARLVDDLQELSRVEAGAIPLRIDAVRLDQIADALASRMRQAFEERGVGLRVALPASLPAARADADRLVQVLTNLLSNALRHTPAGGEVTIAAARAGERVEVSVRDTGAGIAAEHLPHVFERFYRADAARARAAGGSGVGLTIARALVEAQGGSIRAESPGPGRGSTFTISLPVA